MSQRGPRARQGTADSAAGYTGAGVYPKELVPAMRPDDYIRTVPDGTIYRVDVMVPQPTVETFTSGISPGANGTSTDNEATNLELPDGWLGQYRLLHPGTDIPNTVEFRVDLGGSQAPMYTNKNVRGFYTEETAAEIVDDGSGTNIFSDQFNTHLTELYVLEDEVPFFTFDETAGNTPTIQNVRFGGFQYRLEERSSPPQDVHVEPVPTERVRDK